LLDGTDTELVLAGGTVCADNRHIAAKVKGAKLQGFIHPPVIPPTIN
jgi:hypothetical protein